MTAFGQIDQAVALVRAGAHDYLTKPFDLAILFQKAREILSLRVRDDAQGALGVSPSMRRIEALLRRLAPRSLPILLTGETGSGKEVCARFLHQIAPAAAEPFMAVNCAAIPAELLEVKYSATNEAHFQARINVTSDMLNGLAAASSSSTKSRPCHPRSSRKCCACSKSGPSTA